MEAFANSGSQPSREITTDVATTLPNAVVYGAQRVAVYRDDKKVLEKLKVLAAAAGSEWYYRWSTKGKGGKTEWVEGPSIKLADDLARIYGNCDLDTRVVDLGGSWLLMSRFIDLETGYSRTRPYQQRKSQQTMKGDADRARDIAFQIGVSKAERNVVVHSLRTYADYAFQEAKNSLIEKIGKNLDGYRDRVLGGLEDQSVEKVRVEQVLGRAAKDWLAPDIAKVIAVMKAVADGMQTWEEAFPPVGEKADSETGDKLAAFAKDHHDAETGEVMEPADQQQKQESQTAASNPPSAAGAMEGGEAGTGYASDASPPSTANNGPTNDAEYREYALAWIAAMTDPEEPRARWAREKIMRNKANVSPETREELEQLVKAKVTGLKKQ